MLVPPLSSFIASITFKPSSSLVEKGVPVFLSSPAGEETPGTGETHAQDRQPSPTNLAQPFDRLADARRMTPAGIKLNGDEPLRRIVPYDFRFQKAVDT